MAVDMFLKLDGIKGESTDKQHKDEIDIESFSWGESNFAQPSAGGAAGKVAMQDFHFVMKVSKASPLLFLHCASGEHIKTGILTARKAGATQQEFLKWTFTDLLISSFQTAGASATDILPMESISLNFAKIAIEYKLFGADGSISEVVAAGWDVRAGQKV